MKIILLQDEKKLGKKGYPFGKSALYKKGKTNSHWMRIK